MRVVQNSAIAKRSYTPIEKPRTNMMAGTLKDFVSKMFLLVVLIAIRPGAGDDSKDWLWKLLTSRNDSPGSHESSYARDEEIGPSLLPKSSQLRLDPKFLAELKQELREDYLAEKEKEMAKRQAFGGLLCCNQPPTRPPSRKKPKRADYEERVKDWIISQLFEPVVRPGADGSGHALLPEEASYDTDLAASTPNENLDAKRGDEPFWLDGANSSGRRSLWSKRANVMVVPGGYSDVNT
ncbi:hypothetical protein RRG08_041556 [Elysia crispata]|uniref:Uncharacterized protein n=1 Tax=Elysia crispata TaxID=231223 RepID=A0AAE1DNE7_9GAST|nr:hypothetical protein RRG08_041556 [Elysia crispata]